MEGWTWCLRWLLFTGAMFAWAVSEPGCPALEKGSMGICMEECATASDCEAAGKPGHLCCSNGCGHVCTKPSNAKVKAKPFEIMAVVQQLEALASVKESVPKPLSASELRSVKVLTLKYGGEQRHEACQAFRKLQSNPEVVSAEWGSPAPICGEIEL